MTAAARHHWITGGRRADRARLLASLELPAPLLPPVDAHRRLRGPYTAAGAIMRALAPEVQTRVPELTQQYDIELLSAAPELAAQIPNSRETLTSMAIPAERTRFYARLRTKRIANGLVEFLTRSLADGEPRLLVVENAESADPTDLEFLTAAIRRTDPRRLQIAVCSATVELPDQDLLSELGRHATRLNVDDAAAMAPHGAADPRADLAWAYLLTDCTSDDPALLAAYQALPPARRAALHDRRAAGLEAADQFSLQLGAIPYHREQGSDPHHAGVRALHAAEDYCVCMGFYEATADYGYRALALFDPADDATLWWKILAVLGLALSILSRTHEALDLFDQSRLKSTDPVVHATAAYSTAMLYTRHNEPAERNEFKAKAWLNSAIAIASLVADPVERSFQSAFYRNGLALVEVNLGDPTEALRLVNESIDMLDRELEPDQHVLHRSVLKNNRARVYNGLGRPDDALADYAVVIKEDPNHAEHYLERGNILRRLGRYEEAAVDYQRAMRLSPPFPEIYYNRGDLRLIQSDVAGALADFSYALELDPSLVDAYINRAGIYLDAEDTDAALRDAQAGLEHDPDNAYLHVVVGEVRFAAGDLRGATAAYDKAIASDPRLQSAWGGRAAALFEGGDTAGAITSLTRALEIGEDAALLFNRATAYEAAREWPQALADLNRARNLSPEDPDIAAGIGRCEREMPGITSTAAAG
jgi:tetratricopeptide (TPR) repeat protein